MLVSSPATPTEFGSPASPERFAKTVYSTLLSLGLPSMGAQLLTAHMALSTGWGKAAAGYNFTGLKAGSRGVCYGTAAPPSTNYACLCTFEYSGGSVQAGCDDCPPTSDGKPRCKHPFRVFSSLAEGLTATLNLLKASRHAEAWSLLQRGDPEYYRALSRSGWYTAPVEQVYAGCMARLKDVQKYLGMPDGNNLVAMALVGVATYYVITKVWPRFRG